MKNRAVILAVTACLVSSLAFADSPTDAPLVTTDGNTTFVQQENCKDHTSRQRHHKKDKSLPSKPKHEPEHPSQNNREKYESNPGYPASNDDLLPKIRKPVLITHGAVDTIVIPATVHQHKAAMPHAQVQLMANTGHAAFWDNAPGFNEGLHTFCESL